MNGADSKRKKAWSHSEGPYGFRIRVFEDPASKIIYAEMRDSTRPCGYRSISLRHRDRERALAWARQQSVQWEAAGEQLHNTTPTLTRILTLYEKFQTPTKSKSEQQADRRRDVMWTKVLGANKDLATLTAREWQEFTDARRSGAIDAKGAPVPGDKRKPVRDGTVWSDLVHLRTVLHWAMRWRGENAQRLLREDPTLGLPMPRDKNPRRPVATQDRFETVRAAADQVMMVEGRGETRRETRSFLPEILDLAHGTGRRISAILALRRSDLNFDEGPHGAIRWPAVTDKTGREWLVPMSQAVRAAIDRALSDRPVIGAAYLFPSPVREGEPVSKEIASRWLVEAEKLAGVPKQEGSLWHAYRRGWATARKHWPVQDVMAAGGWSEPTTLQSCYQQADQETMYRVVSEPARLREAR